MLVTENGGNPEVMVLQRDMEKILSFANKRLLTD